MSGAMDDLSFEIKAELAKSMASLQAFNKLLNITSSAFDSIDSAIVRMASTIKMPADQLHQLQLRFGPIQNSLERIMNQGKSLHDSVLNKVSASLGIAADQIERLSAGTAHTKYQMLQLASASQQVRAPEVRRISSGGGGGGRGTGLVRAAAVGGQLAVLSKLSTTMRSVDKTFLTVSRTSMIAASSMDRFRMALAAPQVNPEMNVVKKGIEAIGDKAAWAINKVREATDAFASDIPGTVGAAARGLGKINVELDKSSATMSKHVSRMQTSSKGLTLMGKVFPFLKGRIQEVQGPFDAFRQKVEGAANKLDETNAKVAAHANSLRKAQFILDGTWQELGGSADMFARATYHANLPLRLMKREWEGATRVVRAAIHVFNFVTAPIHGVAMAISKSAAQFKEFRSQLPKLTGGLQIGTRLFRAFAHATYFTGPAMSAVGKAASLAGRGIWAITSPARAVTTGFLKMIGVQNTAIGRLFGMKKAADGTSASMTRLGTSSSIASRGMSGLLNKANMLKTGMAGMAMGVAAWGGQTALAVEKNNAVFGIMLKDVDQGKAVVDSLRGTKAASLFDNQELLDSGRLLFKSGVAAQDLAGKTDQLATIAIATSTDLGDLARVYQQGASVGKFGQDKINQLAERGIDIYHALESATGQSGTALQKMISEGKIGTAEMDAALLHLTGSQGIYGGALDVMANTTAGRFAKMKNDIGNALGDLMGVALAVLNPIVGAFTGMATGLKSAFESFTPQVMFAATTVGWFFKNWFDIAKFTWTSVGLMAVTAFNDLIYFFTDKIPAYLNWFSENWRQVFMDAGSLVVTVFANIGTNIKNAMAQIWAYIKSGGKTDLQFAFTPLLDGFKATVSQIPEIPERAMTDLEKSLTARTEQLGAGLANDFDAMLAKANESFSKPQEINGDLEKTGKTMPGETEADTPKNSRTSFVVDSLDRGSSAALNAIYAAQGKDKTPKQQLGVLKKIEGHMAKVANKSGNKVAGKV